MNPAAIVFNSEIHVVVRATNGNVDDIYWNGSSWSAWSPVDSYGHIVGKPALGVLGNQLFVVARGTDNVSEWSDTETVSHSTTGWNQVFTNPAVASGSDASITSFNGQLQIVIGATDGSVWEDDFNGRGWGPSTWDELYSGGSWTLNSLSPGLMS